MTVVEDVHEVLSSLTESGMSNRRGTVVTVFPTMREEAIIAWICSRYNEGVEKPKRVCFYIEKHSSLEDDETSDDLEWMLEVGDATRDFPNMLGEALLKYRMEENDLGIDLSVITSYSIHYTKLYELGATSRQCTPCSPG